MSAIAYSAKYYLSLLLDNSPLFLCIKLAICSVICAVSYFTFAVVFKIDEAKQVMDKLTRKLFNKEKIVMID